MTAPHPPDARQSVDGPSELVRTRARAYDAIYSSEWSVKQITIDSYERSIRFFLDVAPGETGHADGNELEYAMGLIGVDDLPGKTVLDYCCGAGRSAIYFALKGAQVCAFDASSQGVEKARHSAEASGVADRISFQVASAAKLAYPDNTFDVAFCQSALHILIDYPGCREELARVLKPGARAVFCEEPLGHNPILEMVRWWRRRKYRRCGGRTLRYSDLSEFGRPFAETRIHHFNLLSQVKQLFGDRMHRGLVKQFLRVLDRVDKVLLSAFPPLRRFCGKAAVEYVAGETRTSD